MGGFNWEEAEKVDVRETERRQRGEEVELFRVIDHRPWLEDEEEWANLNIGEAAIRMEDLTGVGADLILSDFDEACGGCKGTGWMVQFGLLPGSDDEEVRCPICHGTGKRRDPWEFTDEETGREVTLLPDDVASLLQKERRNEH
jgi:hypothetical protein